MSERDSLVCNKHQRIAWVHAHGPRKMFDSQLRLAENDLYPAAIPPHQFQVGIDRKRRIGERGGGAEVVDQPGERNPRHAERERIVVAKLRHTSSEALGFGGLLHAIYCPAMLRT